MKSIEDKKIEGVNSVEKQKESSVQSVTEHTDSEIQRMTQRVDEIDTSLGKSIAEAAAKKSALDETVGQANALDTSLSGKIEEGTQLNKDITASGQKAVDDINNASKKAIEDINATGATDKEQIAKNKADIALLDDKKANGKGISFSINESGGLRVTYDDGK